MADTMWYCDRAVSIPEAGRLVKCRQVCKLAGIMLPEPVLNCLYNPAAYRGQQV